MINNEKFKRIIIIGSSCSGKTTFAKKLAKVSGVKHIEMDRLNWLPDWQERPPEEFRNLVKKETSEEKWILDGNYSRTREITWPRATHVIWLNFSFPVVMYRAVKRTTKRAITKEEICNGNHETFRQSFLSTDSMILWALRTYHSRRRRYRKQIAENKEYDVEFITFKSSKEADKFLREIDRENH